RIATSEDEQARLALAFAGMCAERPSGFDDTAFGAWCTAVKGARAVLVEAGWRSVPILLGVLDDEQAAMDARTRAFHLLHFITGVAEDGWGFSTSVVSSEQVEKWREWRTMLRIEVR